MDMPPQSSIGNDVNSVEPATVARKSGIRRRILIREIIFVFVVLTGLGIASQVMFGSKASENERYIGSTLVTFDPRSRFAADMIVWFGSTDLEAAFSAAVLDRTSPVDNVAPHVRLGDVGLRKVNESTDSVLTKRSRYVCMAAISDARFMIGEPERAAESAPYDDLPGDMKGEFGAESASERANTQRKLRESTKQAAAPVNQSDGAAELVRDLLVTPEIVTSATMSALLRAEKLGLSSVLIVSDDWLEPVPVRAIVRGTRKVEPHLTRVRHVVIDRPSANVDSIDMAKRPEMLKLFRTPLAWPGGEAFYLPREMQAEGMPADTSSVFNAAFRSRSRTTPIPTVALLVGLFGSFLVRLRKVPSDRLKLSARGLIVGGVCYLLTLTALYGIRMLWHLGPDHIFGSLPVLMSAGLMAGMAIGTSAGWVRTRIGVGSLANVRADNVLRSVLHPDTPIEDIKDDRLGFGPVVDALRRFLDNPATKPPVVLSVNGPWGSGKSSVMKMLDKELEKTHRFSTVWFNAWRFHQEEQILAAFLKTITTELRKEGLSWRLALTRLRHYSVRQYLVLLAPIAIVLLATLNDRAAKFLHDFLNSVPSVDKTEAQTEGFVKLIGIGGTLAWFVRMMVPFHLQFRRLYETKDQSKRLGFLDEFTSEFDLYREAVGDRKFVIFIDDLDRCPPDKIVDVLRTINLITTSGRAASTTFFVLAYDQTYITRSIDNEYKRSGSASDENFGVDYLKKMVTLSVSVPTPTAKQRTILAKRLGDAEKKTETNVLRRDRVVKAARAIPKWSLKLATAVSILGLLSLLAAQWKIDDHVTSAVGTQTPATAAAETSSPVVGDAQYLISIRSARAPASGALPWWAWALPMGLAIVSGGALYVGSRPTREEIKYVRQPKDTQEFIAAVEACEDLLPENPRDVVRVLNAMRMQYLVQCIDFENPPGPAPEPVARNGNRLTEWECVSYSVLQLRYPILFSYRFFTDKLGPALRGRDAEVGVAAFYESRREKLGLPKELVADIICLKEKMKREVSHIADATKFDRYVKVNRYVLEGALIGLAVEDSSHEPSSEEPEETSDDESSDDDMD